MTVYKALLDNRVTWTPAKMEPEQLSSDYGIAETIHRCIALALALELPVGEFTLAASKGDLPNDEHIRHLLEANADDEQTHFIGFQNLAIAYKTPKELVQEAEVFTKSIIDNPEHTLVKSGVLELGVFFVSLPLMRKIGPIGAQLLSGNVSRDEARHVKTNFEVMDEMGYNIPISLDKARKEAVAWLTSNLTLPGLGPDYWMRQSDKLISTRKAPDLKWTKRGQVSATFEISNRNMGDYATNHQ